MNRVLRVREAFFWNGTEMIDIGGLVPDGESNGWAVNANGWVTGWAKTEGGAKHAFLWDGTEMIDLGAIIGSYDYSVGWWISEDGMILGQSTGSDGHTHIVSWTSIPPVPALQPTWLFVLASTLLALGLVGIAAGRRRGAV
jgi:probable HAF family extracellular repeat protein